MAVAAPRGVVVVLALGAWLTLEGGQPLSAIGLTVVVGIALVAGTFVGWYSKVPRSPRWSVLVFALLLLVVFIVLTNVHGTFGRLEWAWMMTSFAGMVIGADLPHAPTKRRR